MKTFKLIVFGMMLIFAASVEGQVSVRLNVGTPPAWGPAGYNGARYYYLPDIESYYDVNNSTFIYFSGNTWIHSRFLPARYKGYDLYHGYKVVMNDYHGNAPYQNFREYRTRYARGYRGREQHNIGERHDNRERGHEVIRNHGNERAQDRNFHPNNGRDNHQNNERMNQHNGSARGNEKNKNEGHDK